MSRYDVARRIAAGWFETALGVELGDALRGRATIGGRREGDLWILSLDLPGERREDNLRLASVSIDATGQMVQQVVHPEHYAEARRRLDVPLRIDGNDVLT
jgi:hypothetical protein